MKLIKSIVRPSKVDELKEALGTLVLQSYRIPTGDMEHD